MFDPMNTEDFGPGHVRDRFSVNGRKSITDRKVRYPRNAVQIIQEYYKIHATRLLH